MDSYIGNKIEIHVPLDSNLEMITSEKDEYVFIVFENTGYRVLINDNFCKLKSSVICIKPEVSCKLNLSCYIKWIYKFNMDDFEECIEELQFRGYYTELNELNPKIILYTKEYFKEFHKDKYSIESTSSYLEEIIISKFTNHLIEENKLTHENTFSDEINLAIEFMYHNIHKKIVLEDMAYSLNMGVSTFCRLFKNETGYSPAFYLHTLRLERAKRMLEKGNDSITEIALLTGLGNSSYFASKFKKVYGISPLEYRSKCQK